MTTTQINVVRDYMLAGHKITSKEAFEMFGITRLSAVIFALRKRGFIITTTTRKCKTRLGTIAEYGEYELLGIEKGAGV